MNYGAMAAFAGLSRLLVLLTLAALVVLCLVFWRRLGRGAVFALLGFAAFLIGNLMAEILTIALPRVGDAGAQRSALAAEYLAAALFDIAGLLLLAVALFLVTRQRPAAAPTPYYGTQPNLPRPGPAAPPPPPPAQPGPEGPAPLWPGTPPN